MKANLFVRIYAAVLRTLFPQIAVKYFTLKSRSHATLYLPSVNKQLRLIDKLGFDEQDLQARCWSYGTRTALFQKGNYSLLPDIFCAEEFDIIVEKNDIGLIARAMRYYIPVSQVKLELLKRFGVELVKAAPSVFLKLEPYEILGIKKNEAASVDCEGWKSAEVLACTKPSLAPLFMKELTRIAPENLGEIGNKRFILFFNQAFRTKEDISEMMPYMKENFPELYAKVRDNVASYPSFQTYFCKMFPLVQKHLGGHEVKTLQAGSFCGNLEDWADAYTWLFIGAGRLKDERVYNCIWSYIDNLQTKLYPEAFSELFALLVDNAKSADNVRALMIINNGYGLQYLSKLQEKLVEFGASSFLRNQFPFKEWKKNVAKKALYLLVNSRAIPVSEMSKLDSDLLEYTSDLMEAVAQIQLIGKDPTLAIRYKLQPEAEVYLFSMDRIEPLQTEYIKNWKPSMKAFLYILNKEMRYSCEKTAAYKLIFKYAQKWNLSREQYWAILQSSLKEYACELKSYVKETKQEATESVN